ncbi:MauE/DoxX family redox-associated membrane protein [Desulfohalobium retbaense]|uniref:DoxX family protein n=1 Tax=Desulfohalobium retbaense (strain ATCC 49708 / DSM 5692 / JCM 16813 / HR100) TaxID=485915 RepID=C8X224_DESRD|nr:MauE/DoxX family redox-associated membrane protein [Desulfohalobium retbaense]ACV68347.1 DoxX family protein [Desulfohalobium retbaense DSM 5692]
MVPLPRFLATSAWAYRIVRLAFAVMFIIAGGLKLADPAVFATTIDAFGLIPSFLLPVVAIGLPLLEILAGIGLLFDFRGSLTTLTLLTVVFILVLAYGIHLGLDIDCGCYGPGDPEAEAFGHLRSSLYRDLGMLVMAGYLYIWRQLNGMQAISSRVPFGHRLISLRDSGSSSL